MGSREGGGKIEEMLGFGEGLREDCLEGAPNLLLLLMAVLAVESVDVVRLCEKGKLIMLLWMIGEGPRNPSISGVPSLLGLIGLRGAIIAGNGSARWASSGGAWAFDLSSCTWMAWSGPLVLPRGNISD